MKRYRGLFVGLGVVAATMVGASVPALAGSQTANYVGGTGDAVRQESGVALYDNVGCGGKGQNTIGGACMAVGGNHVTVTIADSSGQPTPARIFPQDSAYTDLVTDAILVCGTLSFDLPEGTAFLDIRVGVLGRGTIPIPPSGAPPMACPTPEPVTSGTITVDGPGVTGAAAPAQVREPGQRAVRSMLHPVTMHFDAAPMPGRGKFVEL